MDWQALAFRKTTICRPPPFRRNRSPVYTGGMNSKPDSTPTPSFESFGHFDESLACFVLTAEPPRKWWNLHCSALQNDGVEMYAEVAHINDGPTWVRDAAGVTVRLCGYDNKYHYVRNESTGTVFCPAGMPAPQPVSGRTVEFYREKTRIRSECEDLRVEQRVFVPRAHPLECTTLTVQNTGPDDVEVSVFSFVKFDLGGCDAEGRTVGRDTFAEVHPDLQGVLATNRFPGLPSSRFKGFLIALGGFVNANAYRDHFTRADYGLGTPRILWGWNCDGRPGAGPDCAGIVQVKLSLPAGGSARADFVLGHTASAAEVAELRHTLTPVLLDQWCAEARDALAKPAEAFTVDIGHPLVNGLFNIFLKKQLDHYLINKSGFRDNLQTDMALALCDAPAAVANLLRALASQYADGSVPHGFRPLNRMQYSDKPAWILQTLPEIIKETGDFALLEREVPYFESSERGTVWDHALRAMRFLAEDTGRHGLCRQHHADWNDGLEATAEAGERESVFVSMQLCLGAREMAELARRAGDAAAAREAEEIYAEFHQRINREAWDGEWYVRTLCEDGYRIGSNACDYGKIYLNPQSWAVLSGVAEGKRAHQIMRIVDERLEADIGFRICTPPYASYDPRVGRMSNTLPAPTKTAAATTMRPGFKGVADLPARTRGGGLADLSENHPRQSPEPGFPFRGGTFQLREQLFLGSAHLRTERLRLAHRHRRLDVPAAARIYSRGTKALRRPPDRSLSSRRPGRGPAHPHLPRYPLSPSSHPRGSFRHPHRSKRNPGRGTSAAGFPTSGLHRGCISRTCPVNEPQRIQQFAFN